MRRFALPALVWCRLLILALIAVARPCHAALRVANLACDGITDPTGVDSARPLLSWQLQSVDRGARQTAWQVQVASSREALAQNHPDAWDSGRITGNAQLQIPYQGRRLASAEQVFWRIKAWDETGQASPWSPIATWTMGVSDPRDWTAKWITDPELLKLTRTKLGFSSPPVREPNTPQWLVLDLGATYPIDSIVLDAIVHTVKERLGFPQWFKVELSDDPQFTQPTVVADHTRDGINPWLTRFTIAVPKQPARYLRLTATRLRMLTEDDQPVPQGRLALRQIEVIANGKNLAPGARVTASASLEEGPWSAASVVDGLEIPGANPRAADTLRVRREFIVRPALRRAALFITGLGSYALSVNGTAVGAEDLLKPGWTDAERTCLYDTRDLSAVLRPGRNVLGIELSGGMYNVAAVPGRYTKFVSAPRPLTALAQLRLEYADGSVDTVATDAVWKVAPGPTTFAHVYGGEDYDARREPAGWDRAGFDDSAWHAAVSIPGPGGRLRGISESAPPLRAQATLAPLSRREIRPGVTVYDFGQNAALMPRLVAHGAAGATIKISPAELLNADGSIDPGSTRPNQADASWNYTLAGTGKPETWQPQFFYHGARYLEVQCAAPSGAALPVVDALDAVVVHSDSPAAGDFSCSNEMFNRIATLVRWSQRNNLAHVLTDCPHRERLGWLEQVHLNGPSLRANFDLSRLYVKALNDMADAQHASGLVPDIAPEYVRFDGGFGDSPEWGSAIILAAWQQYVWAGDETSLRTHYDAMCRYFAYLSSRAENHILSHGLGDWYDIGPNRPGVAQLTPIALTATAIYYEDATTLQRIATVLGRPEDAKRFADEADAIAAAFNAQFFDANVFRYATGSQTANAMPVVLGLVPRGQSGAVVARIVDDVRAHDNAVTAGDVGYRYLLRALSDAGRSDVLFEINDQSTKPGYGYQLAHGATSLTEAWDGDRHSSQDHFMLGHIVEWFYGSVAGLAPNPQAPGFGGIIVRPNPVGDLLWARARCDSVRGRFEVAWKRSGPRFSLVIDVPANARARVEIPATADAAITESGLPVREAPGVREIAAVGGRPAFDIGSGHYEFECPVQSPDGGTRR